MIEGVIRVMLTCYLLCNKSNRISRDSGDTRILQISSPSSSPFLYLLCLSMQQKWICRCSRDRYVDYMSYVNQAKTPVTYPCPLL